jgi:hypothetical protein
MNFSMQANGAEMMRIAAPLGRLGEDVALMRDLMSRAGRAVTGGLDIRTGQQSCHG